MGSGGIPNAEGTYVVDIKFGLFASEYEALHEEQQRVRRGNRIRPSKPTHSRSSMIRGRAANRKP